MELLFPLLILALLVPTFLGVRRQKKEMAKVAELQDSLRIGDRVMTTAGLHATVVVARRGHGRTRDRTGRRNHMVAPGRS